ncbi:MAG TPA: glycoside hydrolase family 15 protein [Candidatus Thermoplasmatota archaeon]|nr:glycoside hydrolase family 15 protein [Candidatus Thermoplasmatota archaeon]
MPRDLVLSNGRLHAAFDARYEMRDLHWPRVGWESHAVGHRSRLGVWAGGAFSWVADDGWRRALRFLPDALASDVRLSSRRLRVELRMSDVVLPDADVLLRRIDAKGPTDLRLYAHLDLHVSGQDWGDTVTLDPDTGGLLHYKRDRHFLQNATRVTGFACGQKEWGGLEGTWRDAEDGRLSGNVVSHGLCDGVLECALPQGVSWWWLAVGESAAAVRALDARVRERPQALHDRAVAWWRAVVRRRPAPVRGRLADAYRRSLAIALANVDAGGGVLAALDSDILSFNRDTYAYVWPRDAAFVAHALDVAGHPEPAARALRFLAARVEPDGYLPHKLTVDGHVASTWHPTRVAGKRELPIQEDETALLVWAVAEHVRLTGDWTFAGELFEAAVRRPCRWMLRYRGKDGLPLPSWDPWEERRGTLAYTAATVVAALEGAAALADGLGDGDAAEAWRAGAAEVRDALDLLWLPREGRFARMRTPEGKLDRTEDASLVMLPWLGVLPAGDPRVRATMKAVFARLAVEGPVGGVARYVDDRYHRVDGAGDVDAYPGNPWFVCTLWRADWLSMTGRRDAAREVLAWAVAHAQPSGAMAEQLHPATGAPRSVSPLTWSHAAFVESCWRLTPRRAGGPSAARP